MDRSEIAKPWKLSVFEPQEVIWHPHLCEWIFHFSVCSVVFSAWTTSYWPPHSYQYLQKQGFLQFLWWPRRLLWAFVWLCAPLLLHIEVELEGLPAQKQQIDVKTDFCCGMNCIHLGKLAVCYFWWLCSMAFSANLSSKASNSHYTVLLQHCCCAQCYNRKKKQKNSKRGWLLGYECNAHGRPLVWGWRFLCYIFRDWMLYHRFSLFLLACFICHNEWFSWQKATFPSPRDSFRVSWYGSGLLTHVFNMFFSSRPCFLRMVALGWWTQARQLLQQHSIWEAAMEGHVNFGCAEVRFVNWVSRWTPLAGPRANQTVECNLGLKAYLCWLVKVAAILVPRG